MNHVHRKLLILGDPTTRAWLDPILQIVTPMPWILHATPSGKQALLVLNTLVQQALSGEHPSPQHLPSLVLCTQADTPADLALLAQIARHYPTLPVVVVAHQCSDRFASQVFRSGACVDYLTRQELQHQPETLFTALTRLRKRTDGHDEAGLQTQLIEAHARIAELEQIVWGISAGTIDTLLPRDLKGHVVPFVREGADSMYRLQLEALNVGVLLTDEAGVILSLNPTAARWLDRSRQSLLGRQLFNCGLSIETSSLFADPESTPTYHMGLPGAGTDHIGQLVCLGMLTLPQQELPAPTIQANFWILTDITDERRLRQRDRFLATLLSQMQEGVLVCTLDGVITYWNDQASTLLGYAGDSLIGRHLSDSIGSDLADLVYQALGKTRQDYSMCYEWQAPHLRHATEHGNQQMPWWVELRSSPLRNESGQITGMLMIARDISAWKLIEQNTHLLHQQTRAAYTRLQVATEEMVRAERLRALGQMASGVAHDFNNVLTPILGYAELALNTPNLPITTRDDLNRIVAAARDASVIITRLRAFYRPQTAAGTRQSVELHAIAQQAIDLTRPRWRDIPQANGVDILVSTDLQPVPPTAGDPVELRELLINLIFNAVDAMPNGGTIRITTALADDAILLTVSDTGVGISDEIRHRLFEPFFTTKGDSGSGLGLSICRGIAEHHNAAIAITSAVGQGSIISVRFPLTPAPPSPDHTPVDLTDKLPAFNILYIEDDPEVRSVVSKMLESVGQYVEAVGSGQNGLELLNILRFDIVISDLGMPEMSGIETLTAARKIDPRMATVLLTGWGQFINHQQLSNVDYVLSKPVQINELRRALNRIATQLNTTQKSRTITEALCNL